MQICLLCVLRVLCGGAFAHILLAESPYPGGRGFLPVCVLKLCKYDTHIIDSP